MTEIGTLALAVGLLALAVQIWRWLSAQIRLANTQIDYLEFKMDEGK